jgi:tryptophanyl-tRNA synthetase
MSASDPTSAIFMSDTPAQIKASLRMVLLLVRRLTHAQKKINRYAFSGGRETLEEHRELGGNPDIDVAYQYLSYFEEDDAKLDRLAAEYRAGTLTTGDLKKECISLLQEYVNGYQTRRKAVTDEVLELYMKPRKLEWSRSHVLDAPDTTKKKK